MLLVVHLAKAEILEGYRKGHDNDGHPGWWVTIRYHHTSPSTYMWMWNTLLCWSMTQINQVVNVIGCCRKGTVLSSSDCFNTMVNRSIRKYLPFNKRIWIYVSYLFWKPHNIYLYGLNEIHKCIVYQVYTSLSASITNHNQQWPKSSPHSFYPFHATSDTWL